MRVVVRWSSALLVGVAGLAVVLAWVSDAPDLDADGAVAVAVAAFESVGVPVSPEPVVPPVLGVHRPRTGDPVDTWTVLVDVDGEDIEAKVQRSVGQLVYVDDRIGPHDQQRLLTDDQYQRLGEFRDDAVVDDWMLRNVAATGAAIVIGAVGLLLATRIDLLEELPSP